MATYDDQSLIDLLERHPRTGLRAWTSGDDPKKFSDWQPVDTTGLNGEELFECLMHGRLWINMQRIDQHYENHRDASAELYRQLSEQCPHFKVEYIHSYLLLSSPKAFVYLHLDSYENFFWCIRGGKTFHLYPRDDERMVSQELMEDICSGADDFFEYRPEYDSMRTEYTVSPGDMLSWPQNSPHQVFNNGELNVGLGTFHGTQEGQQRVLNYASSWYFRNQMPLLHGTVRHGSVPTKLRSFGYRVARKIGHAQPRPATDFWAHYRLNPKEPNCLERIPNGPVLAECSRG